MSKKNEVAIAAATVLGLVATAISKPEDLVAPPPADQYEYVQEKEQDYREQEREALQSSTIEIERLGVTVSYTDGKDK